LPSCPEIIEFCQEINVEICPELFFDYVEEMPNVFTFTADFEGIETIFFDWFINGDFVQTGGGGTDNELSFQLGPGTHTICILTETPNCPDGTQFCENITIP